VVGRKTSSTVELRIPILIVYVIRHVEATGLIKNLVITEESGIAKGIRRVVAVTGTEAQEVARTATTLEANLVAIEKTTGKDKDSAMKAFSTVRYVPIGIMTTSSSFRFYSTGTCYR
jgi:hypothetical protein